MNGVTDRHCLAIITTTTTNYSTPYGDGKPDPKEYQHDMGVSNR